MQPVPRKHLMDADPRQNPRAERIKRPYGNQRRRIAPIEPVQHADANSHADRRDERKARAHGELGQRRGGGRGESRDAGAEGEAFEHLVEEDDDEERDEEGVARDDEREADDWDCVSF